MHSLKLWVLVISLVCCILADDEICVKKQNLCHPVPQKEVSCVIFVGERLLLDCSGKSGEKVKITVHGRPSCNLNLYSSCNTPVCYFIFSSSFALATLCTAWEARNGESRWTATVVTDAKKTPLHYPNPWYSPNCYWRRLRDRIWPWEPYITADQYHCSQTPTFKNDQLYHQYCADLYGGAFGCADRCVSAVVWTSKAQITAQHPSKCSLSCIQLVHTHPKL
jgi:hypothetical protein